MVWRQVSVREVVTASTVALRRPTKGPWPDLGWCIWACLGVSWLVWWWLATGMVGFHVRGPRDQGAGAKKVQPTTGPDRSFLSCSLASIL